MGLIRRLRPILFISIIFLSACMGRGGYEEQEQVNIKIAYWDEKLFDENYGNFLMLEFPHIQYEIIPIRSIYSSEDPYEELAEMVEREMPDLLILQPAMHNYLLSQDKFESLDIHMKNHNLPLEEFHPGVLASLRSESDHLLYGIAPTFTQNLLFYNEDLFRSTGVPIPEEQLMWSDFFTLIGRFTQEEGAPGMVMEGGTLWGFLLQAGTLQGLDFVEADTGNTILATDQWEALTEQVTDLVRNQSLVFTDGSQLLQGDAFQRGEAATTFQTDSYLSVLANQEDFVWRYSLQPINANGISAGVQLEQVWSIAKGAAQREGAMEVLSFILSDNMERIFQQQGKLPTRIPTDTTEDNLLELYEYNVGSHVGDYSQIIENLPDRFKLALAEAGEREIEAILQGTTEVKAALQRIEVESEAAWPVTE